MKNNMDAIYISFLPHICIYTYLSSLFLKVRFILSERSDPQQYSLFYKFLLKKAFKKAKFSVFQSIGAQKFYFKNGTNLGEVIFNPVNLDDINILEIIGKKRKKEKKIFSVGRLMKEKNFKLLIDSFILFSEVFPDYTLEIFGEGPLENDLTRYIIDKNLIGKVVLKGVSKEWHKLCRNYSCYVCSSNFEGMSNSLEEAACMGVPCVSTNCPPGGNAELLNNGEFGLLVPPSNVELLSKAMIDIIEQDISFNYEKLFSLCSSNHVLEKWITIIEGVENCG